MTGSFGLVVFLFFSLFGYFGLVVFVFLLFFFCLYLI